MWLLAATAGAASTSFTWWSETVMHHHINEVGAHALPSRIFSNICARRWPFCLCELDSFLPQFFRRCYQSHWQQWQANAWQSIGDNGGMAWHGFLPRNRLWLARAANGWDPFPSATIVTQPPAHWIHCCTDVKFANASQHERPDGILRASTQKANINRQTKLHNAFHYRG